MVVATPRLARRGAIFYYRMAVPKRLIARVGRAELTASLQTKDRLQAKLLCRTLSNAIDRLFEVLPHMHDVSQAEIEERIRSYFQACLNKSAELAIDLPEDPEVDLDFEVAGLRENVERSRRDLKYAKFSQAVTADALRILAAQATPADIMAVLKLCVAQGVSACNLGVAILDEELVRVGQRA